MTFAESQGAKVIGIDLCREMLIAAAHKRAIAGRLALASAAELPLGREVADLVLCSFALSYFPSANAAIAEIARITRKGGRVVVSDLHPLAARAGWKRSFRASDQVYSIDHHNYSGRLVKITAERYGLTLDWELLVCFGAPEREIFIRAGKESAFLEASRVPAIRLLAWVKR
jgi:malonyl-CoA O-methyltransferase